MNGRIDIINGGEQLVDLGSVWFAPRVLQDLKYPQLLWFEVTLMKSAIPLQFAVHSLDQCPSGGETLFLGYAVPSHFDEVDYSAAVCCAQDRLMYLWWRNVAVRVQLL